MNCSSAAIAGGSNSVLSVVAVGGFGRCGKIVAYPPDRLRSGLGAVAQWLEHGTHNPLVVGSIPTRPTFSSVLSCVLRRSRTRLYTKPCRVPRRQAGLSGMEGSSVIRRRQRRRKFALQGHHIREWLGLGGGAQN
jgi:hypothetical protein